MSNAYLNGRQPLKLSIRFTPNAKTKPTKAKPKAQAKKAPATSRSEVASTYVSSPVRKASARRQKRQEMEDEDEDTEDDAFQPTALHSNGYARDSFIVPDNDDEDFFRDVDDDNFGSVREMGDTRQSVSKPLGPPITSDRRMDELPQNIRDFVQDFVNHGKEAGKKILMKKGLSSMPFSDTILREMAIRRTSSIAELQEIPEVRYNMVTNHGEGFLAILRGLEEAYCLPTKANRRRGREDQPYDPNHENVIVILSDDEEAPVKARVQTQAETDDEYGSDIDFDEEDEEEEDTGPSRHFAKEPEASAWMKQMDSLQTGGPKPGGKPLSVQEGKKTKGGTKGAGWKTRVPRKNSSGGNKPNSGGVTKKAPRKRKSGGASASRTGAASGGASGSRTAAASGGVRGGIQAMPI